MSAKTAMLEAARTSVLAALQAVEAAIEAEDAAPKAPSADPDDFSHLTFDDPPPDAALPTIRRSRNGNGKR